MSNLCQQHYFDRLDQAVNAAVGRATEAGIELYEPASLCELCSRPLAYGDVARNCFEIQTVKGRRTRTYWQVIITRLDSGRYELVTYRL